MKSAWGKAIDTRFDGREELSNDAMRHQFWPDLPERDVLEVLNLIESECDIKVGRLRPSDQISTLFKPPPTRNPFVWLSNQVHGGDTSFELSTQLTKRLKQHGTFSEWRKNVHSLDDFVRSWCGKSRSVQPSRDVVIGHSKNA